MSELIDKQQAIDAFETAAKGGASIEDIKLILAEMPSAQPERKTGHWIEMSSANHTYKCSECGRLLVNVTDGKNNISKHYPYCHCGVKMDGGEQDG